MKIRNCPKNLEEASYNCLSIQCVFGQKRDFETLVVLTVVVLWHKDKCKCKSWTSITHSSLIPHDPWSYVQQTFNFSEKIMSQHHFSFYVFFLLWLISCLFLYISFLSTSRSTFRSLPEASVGHYLGHPPGHHPTSLDLVKSMFWILDYVGKTCVLDSI